MLSNFIRKSIAVMLAFAAGISAFAQDDLPTIDWKVKSNLVEGDTYEILFEGSIAEDMHTYPVDHEYSAPEVEFYPASGVVLEGGLYNLSEIKVLEDGDRVVYGTVKFGQKVTVDGGAVVKGNINWRSCTETACATPEDYEFSVNVGDVKSSVIPDAEEGADDAVPGSEGSSESTWALIIEAILWGFAMLLTPCVFPMVPMTISFFVKGSGSKAAGRFKAAMYGLFIVLLYTVPISLIILITRVIGGDAVTADIFNWLATHWLPNLIFFIVFMVFAASFFGAFEITLPSSIVNKSDKNSDKAGLAGVFFMALTLVLVSFSCTGPIVGTVLIKSTQGEFWTPMVTMLAFSVAFALPFTVLALFPSLLKNLPKSGGWLNSVKVVLGFIEVALGFKFLSTADQTYHWGLLDRPVYLAIWIVCFAMMGFYLLGKLRFAHDDKVEKVSVLRLSLAIAVFTFVVYMIPGMFGAPLKALSGYLPPMETQDFVIGQGSVAAAPAAPAASAGKTLSLPHGLVGYDNIDEALAESKATGKPVFVDITGHGCVNCREMEARVWSDPSVLSILRDDYIMVALYTDDKLALPESKWVTTESGKVLKDVGRVNSYIARERFGVNAQPNYALLDSDGNLLAPVRGYNLSIEGFVEFLNTGLNK